MLSTMRLLELRSQIRQKALQSASLEPSQAERSRWQSTTDALINDFIDRLGSYPTYSPPAPDLLARFEEQVAQGDSPGAILEAVQRAMTQSGILTAGPGHLAFVPGGGLYAGAIADHFAAVMNVFSADTFASPVATYIHGEVIRWLASMIGYDEKAWGDITSGGSIATLTAFAVARNARGIHPRKYESFCVYATTHTHHCCEKALDVLFAGALTLRRVPTRGHAMDVEALASMIESDREGGRTPWMVIANAGSTNLGAVDPLGPIAGIAKANAMWMHVDAAYGGFFALCPETAELFSGLSEADSVVLDPHKGMFLPYGCGAVLFKNGELLGRAFAHSGAYLQDRDDDAPRPRSPMDYSLELTRPFRSLRLWLALRIHGKYVFRSALQEKLALAQYCYACLVTVPDIEVLARPDLSIVAFRYVPLQGSRPPNDATKLLWIRLNRHKEFFLSSTTIDGLFIIRVSILSFRTHLDTIDLLLDAVRTETSALLKELSCESEKQS
ncbi:pyridoxal phosphate-dependent decarboxylase family protein [Sorangium sp. So ce1128]